MKHIDLLIKACQSTEVGEIHQLIKQYVSLNCAASVTKRDIYRFVAAKSSYPVLRGVYHDAEMKMAVATDGKMIYASRLGFSNANAGKIIAKDGSEIDGRFPAWSGFYCPAEEREEVTLRPFSEISGMICEIKAEAKLNGLKKYDARINISNETGENGTWMPLGTASILVSFGESGWCVRKDAKKEKNTTPLFKENENGEYILLQPCIPSTSTKDYYIASDYYG